MCNYQRKKATRIEKYWKTKKFTFILNMIYTLICLMLTCSNSSNSTLGKRSLFLCFLREIKGNKIISYIILVGFCGLLFCSSLSCQFYLRTLSYCPIVFQASLMNLKCMSLSVVLKVYIAGNFILPCFWLWENHVFTFFKRR